MLDYNVPGGKLNRGRAVADALIAVKGAEVTPPSSQSLPLSPGVAKRAVSQPPRCNCVEGRPGERKTEARGVTEIARKQEEVTSSGQTKRTCGWVPPRGKGGEYQAVARERATGDWQPDARYWGLGDGRGVGV